MQKHILVLIFSILVCSALPTIAIPTQSAQHPSTTTTPSSRNAGPSAPEYKTCPPPSKSRFPLLNSIYHACNPNSAFHSESTTASGLEKHYDAVLKTEYGTGPAATHMQVLTCRVFFSAAMRKRPDPVLFEKDYEDRHVMNVVELIAFANFGAADPQSSFLEDLKFGEQLYYLLPYVKQVVDALKIRVPKTPKRFRIPTRPKFEDFETYLTNSLWFLQNGIELAFNARERLHTRDIEAVYAQRDLVRDVKDSLATVRSECRRKKFAKIWEWEDLYHKLVVYAKFLGQMQEDAGNTLDSIQYELEPIIRLLDRELPKIPEGYLKTYLQEGREFLENRRTVPPGYRQSGGPPAYNSSHGAGVAHSPQVPPP